MSDDVVSLDQKREEKQQREFVDGVADSLGVDVEGLAEMMGGAPDDARQAIVDRIELDMMYKAHDRRREEQERAQGRDPDECHNMVCEHYVQHERTREVPSADYPDLAEIVPEGRSNFCKQGGAVSCIFRLLEHPPSDPFVDIPSHHECLRILQRIGYVRGDSFENELGTNFMFSRNTKSLWMAYVLLLVETGRVKIPDEDLARMEGHEEGHAKFCCGQDDAHTYFRDRELPDTVATVGELVAQRNALLAFIRGELDWPDGRCPCGEDFHWNGVAHTENCRFRDKETDE
jgi:hypothetical protein